MPTIIGTSGTDFLNGTDGDDIIDGAGGSDTIFGRGGDDLIRGYGSLSGGDGDDVIVIPGRDNRITPNIPSVIDGGSGFDTIDASEVELQRGGDLRDRSFFQWSTDENGNILLNNIYESSIIGIINRSVIPIFDSVGVERLIGSGNFALGGLTRAISIIGSGTITTGSGDDTIVGGDRDDIIDGGAGVDLIYGGGGEDIIVVGAGDRVFGEGGRDTFSLDAEALMGAPIWLDGGSESDEVFVPVGAVKDELIITLDAEVRDFTLASFDMAGVSRMVSVEQVTIRASYDQSYLPVTITLYGGAEANDFNYVSLVPGAQNATVRFFGGGGNDRLSSGSASDAFLSGGDGADHLTVFVGIAHGDAGSDSIFASEGAIAYGGEGDDYLEGLGTLYGDEGDDYLIGGAMYGGAGNDTLVVGGRYQRDDFSDDRADGGDGTDTLSMATSFTAMDASLESGFYRRLGTVGFEGALISVENMRGSNFGDRLAGDGSDNIIAGGGGNDEIQGGGGHDQLDGGVGDDTLSGGSGDDFLTGGLGDDQLDGGTGYDTAFFNTSVDAVTFSYEGGAIIVTGQGRDVLVNIEELRFLDASLEVGADGRVILQPLNDILGTNEADRLIGGSGRDNIFGQGGDDVLTGGGNWDFLNGGQGYDIATYVGMRRQYSASSTSVSGGLEGGTDSLQSIEALQFVDGFLTFDVESQAAQLMRLYDAALDRQPDQGGFEALLDELESGRATTLSLADAFMQSPEFQARYGSLNNQQFVEQLYRFTLNRPGEEEGVRGWVANLISGSTRAELLVLFSESAEHRALTSGLLNAGLWVADDQATTIARLYNATFDRLPDAGGLAVWTAALKGGMPLIEIAAAFASAQEFQDLYGSVSNQQFVEQMYRFCLDREGDAPGVAGWVANMDAGLSRAEVLMFFSESAEHVALTRPLWLGGVLTLDTGGGSAEDAEKDAENAQVLIGLDETVPDDRMVTKADDQPQINGGLSTDGFDNPSVVAFDKWAEDAFILPPIDEGKDNDLTPLVLPDVEDDQSPVFDFSPGLPFHDLIQPEIDPNGMFWVRLDRGDDLLH